MKEKFMPINGFEEQYKISNLGNISSIRKWSRLTKTFYPIFSLRKKSYNFNGREKIRLISNGKDVTNLVHRLVADHFIPNPEKLPQINHIDGNPKNNRVDNLEWCNQIQNMRHAIANGLFGDFKGIKNPNSKLTVEQVLQIRKYKKSTKSMSDALGVTQSCVINIIKNKSWKSL